MSKIINGKKLSTEESQQILNRMRANNVSQSFLARYLTSHGYIMGPSNVGKLVRGEISGKEGVFYEIKNFLLRLEKINQKSLSLKIKNGIPVK